MNFDGGIAPVGLIRQNKSSISRTASLRFETSSNDALTETSGIRTKNSCVFNSKCEVRPVTLNRMSVS